MTPGRPRVLFVDDEELVLEAMQRQHGRRFDVSTAIDGPTALELVRGAEPFAVVVSDYNMPRMDGIAFLERMRDIAPKTVRILLTGQADMGLAILAVNRGAIFRFVSKPCRADEFAALVQAAVEEHRSTTTAPAPTAPSPTTTPAAGG